MMWSSSKPGWRLSYSPTAWGIIFLISCSLAGWLAGWLEALWCDVASHQQLQVETQLHVASPLRLKGLSPAVHATAP